MAVGMDRNAALPVAGSRRLLQEHRVTTGRTGGAVVA